MNKIKFVKKGSPKVEIKQKTYPSRDRQEKIVLLKTPVDVEGFYQFNIKYAIEMGVNQAVVFNHIGYWVTENARNKSKIHYRDGTYWTYMSYHELSEKFPFWSERQIRTIISSLIKNKFIIKGGYSLKLYYRANWYTIPEVLLNQSRFGIGYFKKKDKENLPPEEISNKKSFLEI